MSGYGFSAYDSGFLFQDKIWPSTAHNYYGLSLYTPLNVSPFTAVPRDYGTIMLNWVQPQGGDIMEFRLIGNRYGYPVDENDGNILIDSTSYPGSAYADQDVIPGTYHYYGIYILNESIWNRCGFASCLAPFDYDSGGRMFSLLPTYFREVTDAELTQESADNTTLKAFLDVIGWGMDYLRTQYDMIARHVNDPMRNSLGDMINLAGELGMPFQPELPAYIMRKSTANWTHVAQERGTAQGIGEQLTLLTGYPVDLRSGRNLMLENDQAIPADPAPAAWVAGIGYAVGEMVTYGSYLYKCIATGGLAVPPTGTTAANTYWQAVQNTTDPAATLANANTVGGLNTWEAIYPALDSGGSYSSPAGTLVNTIGLPDPQNSPSWTHGAFTVFNKSGATRDVILRSVSRIASDKTGSNTTMAPDPMQAVLDGVPVPVVSPTVSTWGASARYATDTIVIYQGLPYQALRASTGAAPPVPGEPLNANPFFDSTIAPWAAVNGATIAQSSAQSFQGVYSLLITPNGTSSAQGAASETVTVIPGATYTASAWAYLALASSSAQIGINWFDQFGQLISSAASSTVSALAATWTSFTVSATAPGNAASGQIFVQVTDTPPASLLSYWDAVSLSCQQTPEWCVLSPDSRLRFMFSAYAAQSLTTSGNQTVQAIPFVEWYDQAGNLITSNGVARVVPRVASAGTPGIAPGLTFDSFSAGSGSHVNGRQTDTQDQNWSNLTGTWSVSEFGGGSVFPSAAGTRAMAVCTGQAGTSGSPVYLGVTFVSAPQSGQDAGIVFRATSTSAYWRAGMSGLYSVSGGASTLVGTYSTPCQPGDRLVVYLSGSAITVYRNGAQVLTVTNSYNSAATLHGLAVENTGV